jgi:hypothetical protein
MRKSFKLSSLQRKYMAELNERAKDSMKALAGPTNTALQEYYRFCLNDRDLRAILHGYKIDFPQFEELVSRLERGGLGQKIKGHYAALSSLTFGEPLIYVIVKSKDGTSVIDLCGKLLDYWDDRLPAGYLLQELQKSGHRFQV